MSTTNTALVVLVHNQAANIPRLLAAYKHLTKQPHLFVFVCDRCDDDSVALLRAFDTQVPVSVLDVRHGHAFQAGRNRDIGAAEAERSLGPCNIVFLDGDCVPAPELLRGYAEVFGAARDYPVVVCGRRVNESETGAGLVEDNRLRLPSSLNRVFASNMHRLVVARDPIFTRLATWSCNLGLNARAVELQRRVNDIIDNHPTIFNDGFNGRWGGEDDFVGMVAAYMGMAVVALDPGRCYVTHIWHPSHARNEYEITMNLRAGQLRQIGTRLRMPGVAIASTSNSLLANEVDRAAATNPPTQLLALVMSAFDVPAEDVPVYWQVLAAHTSLSGPLTTPKTSGTDIGKYKIMLERIRDTPIDAVPVLGRLTYNYVFPEEAACNICGSSRGYNASGRCRGCMSMPWHRIAAVMCKDRMQKPGLITNPEQPGEKRFFSAFTATNYHVHKIDLTALPYQDQSFDTVVSTQVLEHVRDDAAAVREIARVLTPTGQAILAFPYASGATRENLSPSLTKYERRLQFYWHDHYRTYGLTDIRNRFRTQGLDITAVSAASLGGVPGCADDEIVFRCCRDTYKVPAPTRLYLDVYRGCNYACASCNIHNTKDPGDLDVTTYKLAITEFAAMGGTEVHFQSGESWLRKAVVVELATHAYGLGLDAHLVTNGSAITAGDAEALKVFKCVSVSIDSHVPAEHDTVRGVAGAYVKAIAALGIAGSVTKTIAGMILTQSRIAMFPDYVSAMLAAGADAVGYNIIEPDFSGDPFAGYPYYRANKIVDVDALEQMLRQCLVTFPGKLAFTDVDVDHACASLRGVPGCGASTASILLSRDRGVRLCASKPAVGSYVPGGLAQLWTGLTARNRREQDQSCARPCATGNCNKRGK